MIFLLCCTHVQAQNVEGQIIASQYGEFKVASQSTGAFQFPPATCQVSGGNKNFDAFSVGTAVKIVDSNPALTEVATPSSVYIGQCVINMATTYTHVPPFYLTSGTGGLQEAITANQQGIAGPNSVILNAEWYALIQPRNAATVIASVHGNTSMPLVDITTTPYTWYQWGGSAYAAVTISGSGLPLSGGTMYGTLFAPNINGEVYPASCGLSPAPSWCSGTTADAWIRAACTQLPAAGGTINLLGLTGTIAASVPCSTPTKQVITLQDPTSTLTITESDGGIVFPLDNGSMLLGPGAGQCTNAGGIHLASGASVTAIVGPAHTDGTQENFTANGLCIYGAAGATVSKGLIYASHTYANTSFDGNTISVCNTACMMILDSGSIQITNNWLNVSDGVDSITGTPLIIQGTGGGGCNVGPIWVTGDQIEHALGGSPEIVIEGDGTGSPLACDIHIKDVGIERQHGGGTPSSIGISIADCKNCSVDSIVSTGVTGGSAMVQIASNSSGSVANVSLTNISNIFGSYANTVNDTSAGVELSFLAQPLVATYYSNPGYVQPPALPGTTLQSVGSDVMSGLGNFSTGSSTIGTDFYVTGCFGSITCTLTRTNSSPPPGYTYSQEVDITANSDTGVGFNGLQYGSAVSFTAGQTYIASFWGKGDGTFTGLPTFVLQDTSIPAYYCTNISPTAFTTTWTLYSFTCTPTTSGSAYLAVAARTPIGATGAFWFGGFVVAPVAPLTPGNLLSSISPYGVGPATTGQQAITINSTPCELGGSCSVTSSGASPYTITASGTPVINLANGPLQTITLTSAATATVTGIAAGSRLAMQICEGSTVYAWTWAAAIHGGICVGPSCSPYPSQANTCSMQTFNSYTGTTLVPENIGVVNVSP
ncbi:MAG TPA: hypothetical protein VMQ60_03290 [Acidobacteriaceae bacterium]|nr:hypothetical protein [Acidobacteriaceae bacterium]